MHAAIGNQWRAHGWSDTFSLFDAVASSINIPISCFFASLAHAALTPLQALVF
jgi:hypothetical protein